MPRQLFVKFRPIAEKLRGSWYFRVLGPKVTDPRLWGVNRRAITMGFAAGIAITFIPLPAHLVFGLLAAMIWHLNVPAVVGALLVFNPFTAVPIYYFAYRVGVLLLGYKPGPFAFELSWNWLQTGLGAVWKPFLIGCLVCSVVGGYLTYQLLELLWRVSTVNRMNARRGAARDRTPPT
jgi:uncharacterized protein (DUF2062 family)